MQIKMFGFDIYVKKSTIAIVLSLFIVIAGIFVEALYSKGETIKINNKQDTQKPSNTESPINEVAFTPEPPDLIKVYVTGCVVNPGIVTLKKGQIVEDALSLAGGVTEDADMTSINRVYKLKENVMLYVKSKNEQQRQTDQKVEKDWSQSQGTGPGIELITDSAGSILGGGGSTGVQKKININTATEADFDTLPGIGKETAKTIVEFRAKNGGFKDIKDLMKITGIKESRFNSIKDLIAID